MLIRTNKYYISTNYIMMYVSYYHTVYCKYRPPYFQGFYCLIILIFIFSREKNKDLLILMSLRKQCFAAKLCEVYRRFYVKEPLRFAKVN